MTNKKKLFALGAVAAYGAGVAALWAMQDKLVFKGAKRSKTEYLGHPDHKLVTNTFELLTEDNVVIHCFETGNLSLPPILVLPGNNGNPVEYFKWIDEQIKTYYPEMDYHLVCLHYRGYGLSHGKLKGEDMLNDILLLCDNVHPVSVFGRSLGAGLGAYISGTCNVPGVFVSPWDNLMEVANDYTWRVMPKALLRRIFKHRLSPVSIADKAKAPIKIIILDNDDTIRNHRTQRLYDQWNGPKELRVLPGAHGERIDLTKDEIDLLLNIV